MDHPIVIGNQHRILALTRDFLNKPILIKSDLKEFNKLQDEARSLFVGPINNSIFDITLAAIQAYHVEGNPEYQQRVEALERFKYRVLQSDCYKTFLTNDYTLANHTQVLDMFSSEAPAHLINEIICLDHKIKKSETRPSTLATIDQLIEADQELKELFKFLANNDRSPNTIQVLSKMVEDSMNNIPQLRTLVKALVLNPLKANQGDLPFSEPLTQMLVNLISWYLPIEKRKGAFSFIFMQACALLQIEAPDLVPILKSLFAHDSECLDPIVDTGEFNKLHEILGGLLAVLRSNQVTEDTAWMVVKYMSYQLLKDFDDIGAPPPSLGQDLRKWLWSVYTDTFQPMSLSWMERFGYFISYSQKRVEEWGVPEGFIGSIVNAIYTCGVAIYGVLDKIIELFMQSVYTFTGSISTALLEYTYLGRACLSIILPESRRRPKAVWAILFANDFRRLTPAEKFAISCNLMEDPTDILDYQTWAQRTADRLNATGKADVKLEVKLPIRTTRLPTNPMVSSKDIVHDIPLMPETVTEATLVQESIRTWLKSGAPQGIDASWFATPERIHHSLSRYAVTRPDIDMEDYYLMKEVAHAMADQAPHLYKDAIYLTPHAAAEKIKKKYSPGLPFIPSFRSRAQIRDHGFFRAIEQVAKEILVTGIPNHTAAHCFEKMNVVGLEKLLLKGDQQKAIVTVVAEDLLSSVVALCALGDLGKRVPKIEDWVMNTSKRSEAGYKPFYEALQERKTIIQADAKQFDSSLGALVAVEGLSELRGIGYTGSAIEDIARSQIRSRYVALKDSLLVSLVDGETHPHTGGLMTGQALTATDNRDAFRMVIIFCWAKATGLSPFDFWKTNTLGNAGDDNAWGSDDGEDIMTQALALAESALGVKVIVEERGFENIDLTGLQIIPVPEHSKAMYIKMGLDVPKFSVRTTPSKMLMKKTEFKVTLSRLRDIQFYAGHIDVLVGSAALTAHNLPIYSHFCNDYMREMEYILLRYYSKVQWDVTRSDDGHITSVFALPLNPRARTSNAMDIQWRKWLKSHRMLSYEAIFKIWMEPNDMSKSSMVKAHYKMMSLNPQLSLLDKANWGFLMCREAFYKYIPTHVARALPEFEGMDMSVSLRNANFVICKFVWLSYYKKNNRIPSGSLLMAILKENPYSSAEDPVSFLDWLARDGSVDALVNMDLECLRGQMLAITLVYWYIETFAKLTSFIPGLGILWTLFSLCTRDVNRLYSVLNYIYMIATGRSSPVISNMMPPDPYAWIKQLAVLITCVMPPKFYGLIPGLKHVTGIMPSIVEWWAAADTISHPNVARRVSKMLSTPREWEEVLRIVDRETSGLSQGEILVIAPTGTGKSTAFIKGLFQHLNFQHTIWLTQPTKTARDNYENDFLANEVVQILMKGVANNHSMRLKVLTPGHLCVRFVNGEVSEDDLVIIDECHLLQSQQLYAYFYTKSCVRMQLSATPPTRVMPRPVSVARYQGAKRFEVKKLSPNVTLEGLISYLYKESPEILGRALIVCPSKKVVRQVILTLGRLSLEAYELSSDVPVANERGIIVATTIVDTAITIMPPPTCLIDLGQTINVTYVETEDFFPQYKVEIVPTPPSTHLQRMGRVGRKGESTAYFLNQGGTGVESQPLPSCRDLLFDLSIAPEVLAAYDIRLGVKRQTEKTMNLHDFIKVNGELAPGNFNVHTLALAIMIMSELSGAIPFKEVRSRWDHYRLQLTLDEDYVVNAESIRVLVDGEISLGNFGLAIEILESGMLGFELTNGQFVAASCLLIKNGYMLPNTFSSNNVLAMKVFAPHLQVHDILPAARYLSLESFVGRINNLAYEVYIPFEVRVQPLLDYMPPDNLDRPLLENPMSGNLVWLAIRGALLRLKINDDSLYANHIEIVFDEEVPLLNKGRVLHVTTRNVNMIRNAYHLDISNICLGRHEYKLLWVLVLGSLCFDNAIISYQNDDLRLNNASVKKRHGIFTTSHTMRLAVGRSLVFSPLRAREYALSLLHHSLKGDNIRGLLHILPIFVAMPNDEIYPNPEMSHFLDSTMIRFELGNLKVTNITGSFINLWHRLP